MGLVDAKLRGGGAIMGTCSWRGWELSAVGPPPRTRLIFERVLSSRERWLNHVNISKFKEARTVCQQIIIRVFNEWGDDMLARESPISLLGWLGVGLVVRRLCFTRAQELALQVL